MTSILPLRGNGRSEVSGEDVETLHEAEWNDGQILYDCRRWRCEALDLDWRADAHLLVLTEFGCTRETNVKMEGAVDYRGRDRPGVLTFIPATVDRQGIYRGADLVFSALWIDPIAADKLCRVELGQLTPFVNAQDDVLRSLLGSLRISLARDEVPGSAYMEHLAALALLHIARHSSPSEKSRGHALPKRLLANITHYVDAMLGEDICLSDLASLADMPVDSFSRAFKRAIGQPPYEFITHRRIERARSLLTSSNQSISAIAFACGFSSQSHLTSTFRRLTGSTPKAYRKQFFPEIL